MGDEAARPQRAGDAGMRPAQIHVADDPAGPAAELLIRHATAGHHIALTGGSTPRGAYRRAAAAGVDWSGATLWFGDERCVPPEDERSNYAMAKASLLDAISGAPPAVHRIMGELGPREGAADYEARLRRALDGAMPALDLVLLGLGPDGHCASLFPGKPAVEEERAAVVGVPEAGLEPFVPRVSLTLPAINAAREVVFLVTGEAKAQAVRRAFGPRPDRSAPAARVAPGSGSLTVLLDAAAASALEGAA
jgi:6-phosphogluconolactonase